MEPRQASRTSGRIRAETYGFALRDNLCYPSFSLRVVMSVEQILFLRSFPP